MLLISGSPGACAPQRIRPEPQLSRLVADAFDLRPAQLTGPTRGFAKVALARQAAMYLARVCLGMTLSDAAALYGRDRTTAAHACRVIEDLRDDPHFDARLAAVEALLCHCAERRR